MGNYKNEYKTLFDVEYDDRNNIIDKMEKEGWELDDESTYYSRFHDEVRVKLSFWKFNLGLKTMYRYLNDNKLN